MNLELYSRIEIKICNCIQTIETSRTSFLKYLPLLDLHLQRPEIKNLFTALEKWMNTNSYTTNERNG